MFRLDAGLRVYLHRDAVDFRKNINGRHCWSSRRSGWIRLHLLYLCSATSGPIASRFSAGIATASGYC